MLGAAIVVLLVLAICLLGLVPLWYLALRRRAAVPECGQCGYHVAGLSTMSCPECGGDFREVGITTPRSRLMHPLLFVLLWTILLAPVAIILGAYAVRSVPRTTMTTRVIGVSPSSGSFDPINIFVEYEGVGLASGSVSSQTINGSTTSTFTFLPGQQTAANIRRLELWTVPRGAPAVSSAPPGAVAPGRTYPLPLDGDVDTAALAAWLAASAGGAGDAAAEPAALAADVDELAGFVRSMVDAQPSYTSTRLTGAGVAMTRGASVLPAWVVPSVVAFWAAIWAGGNALFFRVRRRRQHEAARAIPRAAASA